MRAVALHTWHRGDDRPQRDPAPEPAADEREPARLRGEQAAPDPVRPVADRPVGPARALRRRHDAHASRSSPARATSRSRRTSGSASSRGCSGCTARRSSGSTAAGSTRSAGRTSGSSATSTSTSRARRTSTGSSRVGGFSADEIEQLFETCNERAKPGEIAAVELNASLPQRQLPVRDDPRGGAPARRPEEPPPGDPQGQPGRGLPLAGAPGGRARLRGDHGDQHRQGPAPRSRDRRAVPQEPVRGDLGAGDQADRPAGRRGAARRRVPAADHRQRRDPRLRRLPRVRLGGRRRRSPSGRRSGSSRCRCTRSGRSRGCGSAA